MLKKTLLVFMLTIVALWAQSSSSPQANAPKDVPIWINYVNRSGVHGKGAEGPEWLFILKLSNGAVETVRRGGSTSDGWRVVDSTSQISRPESVTLEKDGNDQTLYLTPDLGLTQH